MMKKYAISALISLATACTSSLPQLEMTLSNGKTVAVDCYAKSYTYKDTKIRHAFNAKDPVSVAINKRCLTYPDYMSNSLNRTGQRSTFIFEHK
ncbi:hypothetical protein CBG46_09860 [Actinobacillus succinogenes]|uniref:Lipoprotein n=1 Tax=Actinobacillus succinogenes (strain ATCC 55618 / DSM 22257 / CCUG 43843 / 130Z) TaxID=339671 RepID=A6VNR8_ACTSZ|nr:hypothetical protein [Actinobacillus succinogenes]ABR74615.1 hypothetical protein Asuc_1255 [Actinobacillus succinogenes 130Z]PHI40960.1 hypothetical protein CBG46_09860 [Actinobacillus succinogenes]